MLDIRKNLNTIIEKEKSALYDLEEKWNKDAGQLYDHIMQKVGTDLQKALKKNKKLYKYQKYHSGTNNYKMFKKKYFIEHAKLNTVFQMLNNFSFIANQLSYYLEPTFSSRLMNLHPFLTGGSQSEIYKCAREIQISKDRLEQISTQNRDKKPENIKKIKQKQPIKKDSDQSDQPSGRKFSQNKKDNIKILEQEKNHALPPPPPYTQHGFTSLLGNNKERVQQAGQDAIPLSLIPQDISPDVTRKPKSDPTVKEDSGTATQKSLSPKNDTSDTSDTSDTKIIIAQLTLLSIITSGIFLAIVAITRMFSKLRQQDTATDRNKQRKPNHTSLNKSPCASFFCRPPPTGANTTTTRRDPGKLLRQPPPFLRTHRTPRLTVAITASKRQNSRSFHK